MTRKIPIMSMAEAKPLIKDGLLRPAMRSMKGKLGYKFVHVLIKGYIRTFYYVRHYKTPKEFRDNSGAIKKYRVFSQK